MGEKLKLKPDETEVMLVGKAGILKEMDSFEVDGVRWALAQQSLGVFIDPDLLSEMQAGILAKDHLLPYISPCANYNPQADTYWLLPH